MSRGFLLALFVIGVVVLPLVNGVGERLPQISATARPATPPPAALQQAAPQPARPRRARAAAPADVDHQLGAGTVLSVALRTSIGSARSAVGDQVDAALSEAVVRDEFELIPEGSLLHGSVVDVLRASPREPRGRITIAFFVIEHARTGSRAAIRSRRITLDAPLAADERPHDVQVAAGQPLRIVLNEPLLVRIPR
jgi:hypothetical protein